MLWDPVALYVLITKSLAKCSTTGTILGSQSATCNTIAGIVTALAQISEIVARPTTTRIFPYSLYDGAPVIVLTVWYVRYQI